jgi:hypothetical protein
MSRRQYNKIHNHIVVVKEVERGVVKHRIIRDLQRMILPALRNYAIFIFS